MYSVFTKLGDGEFLYVASRDRLDEALQLSRDLSEFWPNEYVIRDSKGQDVDPEESSQRPVDHPHRAACRQSCPLALSSSKLN
jgi:hypothetical protein